MWHFTALHTRESPTSKTASHTGWTLHRYKPGVEATEISALISGRGTRGGRVATSHGGGDRLGRSPAALRSASLSIVGVVLSTKHDGGLGGGDPVLIQIGPSVTEDRSTS